MREKDMSLNFAMMLISNLQLSNRHETTGNNKYFDKTVWPELGLSAGQSSGWPF